MHTEDAYPFAADGVAAAHVADTETLVVLFVPQVVVTQLLPAIGEIGVQEATPVGPVVATEQLVDVHGVPEIVLFEAVAAAAVQV